MNTDVPTSSPAETAAGAEWTLERVLAELDREFDGDLPEPALREAQRRREEITPHLIELLRRAAAAPNEDEPPSEGPILALTLLTEFRVQEAWPVVREALLHADEVFGDGVFDILPHVLAVFLEDQPEAAVQLAADGAVDKKVRSAAMGVYPLWVRDGRLSRAEAVARLSAQLRRLIDDEDTFLPTALLMELLQFSPQEAEGIIQEAFDAQLVSTVFIDPTDVRASISGGEAYMRGCFNRLRPTAVDDTVKFLRSFPLYERAQPAPPPSKFPPPMPRPGGPGLGRPSLNLPPLDLGPLNLPPPAGRKPIPAASPERRAERAKGACPCGSGKPYKKCCGRR